MSDLFAKYKIYIIIVAIVEIRVLDKPFGNIGPVCSFVSLDIYIGRKQNK